MNVDGAGLPSTVSLVFEQVIELIFPTRGDRRKAHSMKISGDRGSITIFWGKRLNGGSTPKSSCFIVAKPFKLDDSYQSLGIKEYLKV